MRIWSAPLVPCVCCSPKHKRLLPCFSAGSSSRLIHFMSGMSASDLISRAAREVSEPVAPSIAQAQRPRLRTAAARPAPTERPSAAGLPPGVVVRCNQKLVVCRRWIAMQINKQRVAELAAKQGPRNAGRRLPGRASGRPGA